MMVGAFHGGFLYSFTSVPQMPATSIFMSAASSGTSGIGYSRISILLGPTRTAARTLSAILFPFLIPRPAALGEPGIEARIDAPRIPFKDLVAARLVQALHLVKIAFGIVVVVTGLRIDAFDGTQHFGGEQHVVDRN